jgi:hypothetical protein
MSHLRDKHIQQRCISRRLRCSHSWWDNMVVRMVWVKVDPVDPIGVKKYIQRVEITIPQLRAGA